MSESTTIIMKRVLSDMYFLGRKCIFCNKYGLYKLKDKRVKCKHCKKYYSLKKLRRDLQILYYFYLEISARRAAKELEINESYFGGKRKGNRGRGARNKTIVFGILERKGKVHTVIVQDVSAKTLITEIQNKTKKGSVFYTDGWRSYASLEQYGKHNIIDHEKELVDKNHNHINGIEGFWSFAKERFHKYHGIDKLNYPLYVKEMEFRFNHKNESVFNLLFDICVRRQV